MLKYDVKLDDTKNNSILGNMVGSLKFVRYKAHCSPDFHSSLVCFLMTIFRHTTWPNRQ